MNKFAILTSAILFSTSVQAYDFQYAPNEQAALQGAKHIAQYLEFPNSDQSQIQLSKMKVELSQCMIDHIAKDVIDYEMGPEGLKDLVDITTDFYFYEEESVREQMMNAGNIKYVHQLNYSCVDYHPNQENVVREYAYIQAKPVIDEKCFFEDGGRNFKCTYKTNREFINRYMTKHGLK
jgi:hypothetical protein